MYMVLSLLQFLMSAVAITLPVPSGVFIPVFAMGEYIIAKLLRLSLCVYLYAATQYMYILLHSTCIFYYVLLVYLPIN